LTEYRMAASCHPHRQTGERQAR